MYGHGRLQGIYHQAGDAIRDAMEYEGVVVGPDQAYIWESGNRDLKYSIQGKEGEISEIQKKLAAGTSPVEIIEGIREGQVLDLSGSSCEDLLYIINQDRPVSVYHQPGPAGDRHAECRKRNHPGGIPG